MVDGTHLKAKVECYVPTSGRMLMMMRGDSAQDKIAHLEWKRERKKSFITVEHFGSSQIKKDQEMNGWIESQ